MGVFSLIWIVSGCSVRERGSCEVSAPVGSPGSRARTGHPFEPGTAKLSLSVTSPSANGNRGDPDTDQGRSARLRGVWGRSLNQQPAIRGEVAYGGGVPVRRVERGHLARHVVEGIQIGRAHV